MSVRMRWWSGGVLSLLAIVVFIVFVWPRSIASADKVTVPTPSYPVAPEDQHYLDHWQELPYSEEPYEGAPMIHSASPLFDPSVVAQPLPEPPKTEVYYTSGLETAGGMTFAAGKEIKLPPDIYVVANIIAVECAVGEKCPIAPFIVLSTLDGTAHIRVEADGKVSTWERTDETARVDREKFQFVLDIFDTELIIEPPLNK